MKAKYEADRERGREGARESATCLCVSYSCWCGYTQHYSIAVDEAAAAAVVVGVVEQELHCCAICDQRSPTNMNTCCSKSFRIIRARRPI